jgi:hypothetical protein
MSQLCHELHQLLSHLPRFRFPFNESVIPVNGVYVVFERGEFGHDTGRIVRIGTHTGDGKLRSRLREHFVNENKDRSIFRKNIGRALLNKYGDPFLKQWDLDLTTRKNRERYQNSIDFDKQKQVENLVTEYIRSHFSLVVFRVDEKQRRLDLESKIISTVSWCKECFPSRSWLGLYSPNVKIRQSGLWNVNELYKQPLSEDDLEELKKLFQNWWAG